MNWLYLLATPIPLVVMIGATAAFRLRHNLSALNKLFIGWLVINGIGIWWFNYDAAQARSRGVLVIDGDFVNTFNCLVLGSTGGVVWLIAWLNLRWKVLKKESE